MKKPNKFKIAGLILGIGLILSQYISFAQNPTYACDIRNQDFVSSSIYEFDLYLTRTGITPFELANYQAGITVNPALVNGGTITATITTSSSGLLPSQQPTAISFVGGTTNCIRLAPEAPPRTLANPISSTNGTIIAPGEGTRVCRIRLTNSGTFGNAPLSPVWSTSVNPYNTVVSAFVGPTDHKVNTVITNTDNHGRNIDLTVFLEGPYNTGTTEMNTTLHSLIPLEQPFNTPPWIYTGTEEVSVIPADVVDWVLVDLRDAASPSLALPSTSKAKRALFLKKDGSIVGLDGVSAPEMNFVPAADLYPVIRHRNHIAIMSATGATLSTKTYSYDFSTAITQVYGGGNGYKLIGTGVYGMVAGDIDADGNVFVSDKTIWATYFGTTEAYVSADVDFDKNVFVSDKTKWATNFGTTNPIPIKQTGTEKPLYSSQVPK